MKRAAAAFVVAFSLAHAAAAQVATWPSERPPRPLPAHQVRFPPYQIRTLPNGLQVVAVPHHEEPVVSLRLIVRAGPAEDPVEKPGVASLVSSLLDQGTTSRSAEQIATAIDSIGGALGTGAASDLTFINAIVMKDSLGVGLDLVSDLAQHPAFAPAEIDRQRQQLVSGLRVSYDDPSYLADIVFNRLVYGEHPYGRPQSGTPATVAAVTRDDLLEFHRRWFGANNAILAVVGDVSPEEAFAGATRAFGTWGRVDTARPEPASPPDPSARVIVVDKPGAVQTEIRVGNLAIARKSSDFTALDLAVKVLGGEGANRLHRVLRTERGLTYGASADLTAMNETGDIEAETNTRSATTGETLRLMVDEVWRLTRDRVGDRELGGAQEYLTGSFPLTIETPSQIALQILNAVFYGLDLDQLQNYRERVEAVTVDDVQRVARQYLHPDRLTIVLVGDASSFAGQLAGAGFGTFERVEAANLDLSAPDLGAVAAHRAAIGGVQPAGFAESPPGQPEDARALIDKAIAAKGGASRLRGIRTLRAEATTTVHDAKGPVAIRTVNSIEYPGRFRLDAETPAGRVTQVFADGRYWIEDARGVGDPPDAVRDAIQESLRHDTVPLLLAAASGSLVVRGADADPPLAAVVLSGEGLSETTVYVNRDTGLVERMKYNGPEGLVVENYSDYRDVDGIQVPFHTVVQRGGSATVERDVTHIHFNVKLPAGLFDRPGGAV